MTFLMTVPLTFVFLLICCGPVAESLPLPGSLLVLHKRQERIVCFMCEQIHKSLNILSVVLQRENTVFVIFA